MRFGLTKSLLLAAAASTLLFGANVATAQQASITLKDCDAQYCYTHNNLWTLTKIPQGNTVDENGIRTVTWLVSATKDASKPAEFTVHGAITVTNTGTAPATIGNIVVNLQRPNSPKKGSNVSYVSIAADVADATNGDAATSANIVAAGSQENVATNAAWGTNNYSISGANGTFSETPASGSLEFTDASNNTIFSLVPQPVIPVGGTVTLFYHAGFNVSVLPAAGTPLRVETIVTFGNAGARGGSGATGSNIDINGNTVIDADEAKVRSVPCRVTMAALPATPEECNAEVAVSDLFDDAVTTTGTVTVAEPTGFFAEVIDGDATWTVSLQADGGADGGQVCNAATLDGTACTVDVVSGHDALGLPVYVTFVCVDAADASAESCVPIDAEIPAENNYCTYTKGGYGAGGQGTPDDLIISSFTTVFSSGLTIGVADGGGPLHNASWTATATGLTNLRNYLGSKGGPSGPLTADSTNPTSLSGGTLVQQVATLALNIGFNAAGLNGGSTDFDSLQLSGLADGSSIGTWTLTAAQADALNGRSVSQILGDANTAIGGGGLPAYASSFGDLNQLVTALNESYDNCTPSSFALSHLHK